MKDRLDQTIVRTTDLDELVETVTTVLSGHCVRPTGLGLLDAHVKGFTGSGLGVLHMDYGLPVRVHADPLTDYLALCLPLRGSVDVTHQGQRFQAQAGGT